MKYIVIDRGKNKAKIIRAFSQLKRTYPDLREYPMRLHLKKNKFYAQGGYEVFAAEEVMDGWNNNGNIKNFDKPRY